MPSPTTVPGLSPAEAMEVPLGNVVLDRVAARVHQRLAAEQAASNKVGEGAHMASIIWPFPV
ncbi:HaaA family cyclophane-containing RiPP peptide [Streptomyces sp. NBC_01431]|uniref:HaaA family cyclophane-containing RiPP peptide n=1 Tax=Streptomyces sp. NBC_01431 TaxID=2903863 RepID=UPI002E2F15DA|nr:HaaA family cyclophane-containing RiPP peptide [Streptomyces sp. NBC_01431]